MLFGSTIIGAIANLFSSSYHNYFELLSSSPSDMGNNSSARTGGSGRAILYTFMSNNTDLTCETSLGTTKLLGSVIIALSDCQHTNKITV
jgi:hypothetical protein